MVSTALYLGSRRDRIPQTIIPCNWWYMHEHCTQISLYLWAWRQESFESWWTNSALGWMIRSILSVEFGIEGIISGEVPELIADSSSLLMRRAELACLEIIWMVSYRNLKLRTDQWDSFRSFDLRFFKYLDPCFTAIGLEYWWGQRVGDRGRKLVQLCQHAS